MKGTLVLLLGVFSSFPSYVYSKDGAVHVEGRMLCNGVPVKNLKLEIYEKNRFSADGLWNSDTTDNNGFFSFSGAGSEFWFIGTEPYLYAEHQCNIPGGRDCRRIFRIYVPELLITEGKFPTSTMNIGDFELADDYTNEERGLEGLRDNNYGGKMRC